MTIEGGRTNALGLTQSCVKCRPYRQTGVVKAVTSDTRSYLDQLALGFCVPDFLKNGCNCQHEAAQSVTEWLARSTTYWN